MVVKPNELPAGVAQPQRLTVTDETYESVKVLIMDHAILPRTRISIEALARDLGVSPTPVREALARLESDGLVVKEPLRGYRTTPLLTKREFHELFDMRRLIEGWAVERAAQFITAKGRKQIRRELDSYVTVPESNDYKSYKIGSDHDARFHGLMFELAGNELIRAVWERTHCHLHLFRIFYAGKLGTQALEEHRLIGDAVCAGDIQKAADAMANHIEASRARLAPILSDD